MAPNSATSSSKPSLKDLTLVTTCKGRLSHLKVSLPTLCRAFPDSQIVVVDYGCPEHSGQWVEGNFPSVNVVYVSDDSGFQLSRARNIGAAHVKTTYVGFIDADILVSPGLDEWLQSRLLERSYFRVDRRQLNISHDFFGTVFSDAETFRCIQGYDEVFTSWGVEDHDLYHRLKISGSRAFSFPHQFLTALPHDDFLRTKFQGKYEVGVSHCLNTAYFHAKRTLLAFYDVTELPLEVRRRLMNKTKAAFDGSGSFKEREITEKMAAKRWLPSTNFVYQDEVTLRVTIQTAPNR